ncbi:NitT/TauT family transport system permease protein [Nonomuraea solani]|uniref:NitT/TauT family transport system permease protein n=1 Tax=Nonomuraea solani TaxID=1144553 RepID=A0A1H6B2C2_9ACTN|nr:ABC transporter permease [Nonomuraea solani]SEG55033.1 NitT/TauT family transport system permease protein [Nonomuraea solani]
MIGRRPLLGVLGVAGFLALAELAGRIGLIPDVLPYTSRVLAAAVELPLEAGFRADVAATLLACVTGLAIAIAVAVPAGLLFGTVPFVERSTRPVVEFLRPIPSVSLIPLAVFLFPAGQDAKVALIVYTCAWPLLINTMYGLSDVDPLAKDTLRSFGFGPLAVVLRVSLPSAAPFIATGVRIAVSVTLIVAVSMELLAPGGGGIGAFLSLAGGANRIDRMLAASAWAGFIGLAANLLFTAGERRLFRWHHARTGDAT